jgi:hypothetical protein
MKSANMASAINALTITDEILESQVLRAEEEGNSLYFIQKRIPAWLTPNVGRLLKVKRVVGKELRLVAKLASRQELGLHHRDSKTSNHVRSPKLKTTTSSKLFAWKFDNSDESVVDGLYLTRSWLECMNDGIKRFGLFPIEKQLCFYLKVRSWPRRKFKTFAKYSTAWPMARYLKNETPEKPPGFPCNPLVVTGSVRKFLWNRINGHHTLSVLKTALGMLQGVKRGANVVQESEIFSAMVKHKATLSSPPPDTYDPVSDFQGLISRTLSGFKPPEKPKRVSLEASTSASFLSQRSEGGAREHILRFLRRKYGHEACYPILEEDDENVAQEKRFYNLFLREYNDYELLQMVEVSPGVVVEYRGTHVPDFDTLVEHANNSHTNVRVCAVLEPLKVRLISKGCSLRYYVSKFFQKGMWENLQSFPCFSPTGRPIDKIDLHDLLAREKILGAKIGRDLSKEFDKWVSGDYTGATDHVDIRMTMAIFEEMIAKSDYNDTLKEVLRSVIGPQGLYYPPVENPDDPDDFPTNGVDGPLSPVMQQNGQLMGSTLSFPILCYINLMSYQMALEEYLNEELDPKDLPVLINGDDILFKTNDDFYEVWKKWVARVGFHLSLGKNYIHKNIFTINSECYSYNRKSNSFSRHEFLNCGLLIGTSNKTGRRNVRNLPLWDLFNKTLEGSQDQSRAKRRFLHYHIDKIKYYTRMGRRPGFFNLFLPTLRGGLGFKLWDSPEKCDIKVTRTQRKFATLLDDEFCESVRENDVPKGLALGLVSKKEHVKNIKLPTKWWHPVLESQPAIGPLEENVFAYRTPIWRMPALTSSYDIDNHDYRVRKPDKLYAGMKVKGIEKYKKYLEIDGETKVFHSIPELEGDEIFQWGRRLCRRRINQRKSEMIDETTGKFTSEGISGLASLTINNTAMGFMDLNGPKRWNKRKGGNPDTSHWRIFSED